MDGLEFFTNGRLVSGYTPYTSPMTTEEELRKLKHDLRRPFSNLQMLVTILKGSEMDKQRLIEGLEKVLAEGQEALKRLDEK